VTGGNTSKDLFASRLSSSFGRQTRTVLSVCLLTLSFIVLNSPRFSMAQEAPLPTPSPEASNPSSPSNSVSSEANPEPSPPSVATPVLDHNDISAVEPGESNGTIPLTPPPTSFAQPSNSSPNSNDNPDLSSGTNPLTLPPSSTSLEPGPGTPPLSTADREASNKKWLLLYNFSTGVTYDDNIFISNQNRVADEIFTVSGGFTLGLGDYRNLQENYLLAQYQLTGFFYVHNSQEDSPQQQFALRTQFRFSKLTLQTQTRYDYLTQANRQVGNFVNQNYIDNLIRLNYDYSDKSQYFLSFEQITNLFQNNLNSYEYVGRLGGAYQITPKIRLGGEVDLGELVQEESPTGTYAQLRLLADYSLTGKLALQLSAGGEIRYYDSPGGLTKATPVFSLGLTYRPFPDTSIGLSAYRNVNASPSLVAENYVATGLAVRLYQLLFQRVTVGISAGYENDQYLATQVEAAEANRVDNYFFIEPLFTYRFRDWLSATLSYEFRRNASNESSSNFFDNRVTFSVGVNF
jgi:Putative beta-barrel porin 2